MHTIINIITFITLIAFQAQAASGLDLDRRGETSKALIVYDPNINKKTHVPISFTWNTKDFEARIYNAALFPQISHLPKDRTPSGKSPSLMEFIQRGYLVHVGNIEFEDAYKDRLVVRLRDKPCSYWTLNSVVSADYFENFLRSKHTIITPLAKHLHNIVNISFPEVMVMGEVELGAGDIVLVNINNPEFVTTCTDSKGKVTTCPYFERMHELRKKYTEKGITLIPYAAEIQDYKEKDLKERRITADQAISERGGWSVDMPSGFWLPTTIAKVEGEEVHPLRFFDTLVKREPALSIGSEFYSIKGLAHMISETRPFLASEPSSTLNPNYSENVRNFFKEELKKYLNQFHGFDASARKSIKEFLKTKPKSHIMDTRFAGLNNATEILLYDQDEFVCIVINHFLKATADCFDSFKGRWGNWRKMSTNRRDTIETAIRFTQWARDFSPALTPADMLSKEKPIPSHLELNKVKSLPIPAKIFIFSHLFQREHNRGCLNIKLTLSLFENPTVLFEPTFIDQAMNGDIN